MGSSTWLLAVMALMPVGLVLACAEAVRGTALGRQYVRGRRLALAAVLAGLGLPWALGGPEASIPPGHAKQEFQQSQESRKSQGMASPFVLVRSLQRLATATALPVASRANSFKEQFS